MTAVPTMPSRLREGDRYLRPRIGGGVLANACVVTVESVVLADSGAVTVRGWCAGRSGRVAVTDVFRCDLVGDMLVMVIEREGVEE